MRRVIHTIPLFVIPRGVFFSFKRNKPYDNNFHVYIIMIENRPTVHIAIMNHYESRKYTIRYWCSKISNNVCDRPIL